MHTLRQTALAILMLASAAAASAVVGAAPGDDPLTLDRPFIQKYLGAGVLGAAAESPHLDDPGAYLPSKATTLRYRLIGAPDGAKEETEEITPVTRTGAGTSWTVRSGNRAVACLAVDASGGLGLRSHVDAAEAVMSSFSPDQILLPSGAAPGAVVTRTIHVKVHELSDPSTIKYTGSLQQTCTYVGAYQVATPAGRFDAVLIDLRYTGKIGPAAITDHRCVFFAKGIGTVASIEQRSVSAFLLYHTDTRHGRLLLERPD